MIQRIISGFICLFFIVNSNAGNNINFYYRIGRNQNSFLVVEINPKNAVVKYASADRRHITQCKYDTLINLNNKYKGKYSELTKKNNSYILSPGNIKLKQGEPDSTDLRCFKLFYTRYLNDNLFKCLGWTCLNFDDTNRLFIKDCFSPDPALFWNQYNQIFDSLYNIYTSKQITRHFANVKIRKDHLIFKNLYESDDSIDIWKIWKILSEGKPQKNSILPYLAQYPFSVLPLTFFNFDVAVLSTPFVYPLIIGAEKFITGRIDADKTYIVKFISSDKNYKSVVVKIRNSRIIAGNYDYILPFHLEDKIHFK